MASPQSAPTDERDQDSKYNPGEQLSAEKMGAGYINSGIDQLEALANDPSKKVREAEESAGDTDLTGGLYKPSPGGPRKQKGKVNFLGKLRKGGPIGAIVGILLGGGGFAILSFPTLLPVYIQETFLEKFNSQNTSLTIRTNKVLANKLANDATTGSCNIVKIACQFARPSNSFLKNMEKNGIRAIDSDGKTVEKNGLFPNQRPAQYEYTDKSNNRSVYSPADFSRAVRTDPGLRSAFHRTYNPLYTSFTDSVFGGIQKRFGFSKTNKLAEVNNPREVNEKITEGSKGTEVGARAAAEAGEDATEALVKKLVSERANKITTTVANSGKGGIISLALGASCTMTNIPQMFIGITRAYQLAQLVRFGTSFLTTASAIKSGSPDLSVAAVSGTGNMLTQTVNGKSALDSFGMKNALYGDTSSIGSNYKKFAPGVGAISLLGGVNQVTSSQVTKEACAVATNPVTGASINAALLASSGVTFGLGAAALAVNIGSGILVGKLVELILPEVLNVALDLLKPQLADMAKLLLGDLTANLSGEDVGDALASGASHMMGQTANAGGNMPLSVNDAIAYNNVTKEVQLAYAEEDRATLSPFDASSKNTFLGTILNGFLPYTGQLATVAGAAKTIASVPLLSFSSLINPSKAGAVSTAEQYSLCEDPAIKDAGIAAGPFCNIEYGIPTQYLNLDPQTVVDSLVASGDIDPNTGKPVEKYGLIPDDSETANLKNWSELCMDGTTDQSANCQITDEKTALFAVYTIDHRIQRTMDGMDAVTAESESTKIEGVVAPMAPGFSLSSIFGPRPKPCPSCSSWHRGLDFIRGNGNNLAAMAGTVSYVGGDVNNTVGITHAGGLVTQYLHMELGDISVKVGDVVTAGQVIGRTGNAGQSTGTHLHFTVKIDKVDDPSLYASYTKDPGGTYIDPAEFLKNNGVPGF
ncbi:peptidoglycan DD-metalloendopeptidase family protein [Candidatus Saccharibacteria bacterium]|nr:peptidoglycan DD-metalloendopeptidase family protein [Candidatus Saccharibacteria bacterium]